MAEEDFQNQVRTLTNQNFERQRRDLERLQSQEARDREAQQNLADWQASTREATERSQARALAERSLAHEIDRSQERGRER